MLIVIKEFKDAYRVIEQLGLEGTSKIPKFQSLLLQIEEGRSYPDLIWLERSKCKQDFLLFSALTEPSCSAVGANRRQGGSWYHELFSHLNAEHRKGKEKQERSISKGGGWNLAS